jgi:3-phosphoshikimate 1-carboxyvinyltransferase
MIDEFPILFIAAANAEGTTTTSGLHELRIKESDRLSQMVEGLRVIGVEPTEKEDGLIITGSGGEPLSGGSNMPAIETALDHRIAMSFAVAGLVTASGLTIDDITPAETSFPGFADLMKALAS